MSLRQLTPRFGTGAIHLAWIALFCLIALVAGSREVSANPTPEPNHRGSLSIPNSSFAIADFDGDLKPDLATVEILKAESFSNTQYSIRFELTAGLTQVFGVTAPAGGLQIVARDVNGDDALDLLISTSWLHQQVAVLLNDGHGKFTLADPAEYPASLWGNDTTWKSGTLPGLDITALLPSSYSAGQFEEKIRFDAPQQQASYMSAAGFSALIRPLIFPLLGRAPPRFVH